MSNFASNFAALARSKISSALAGGARDNLSLHRWVLLKNSISNDCLAATYQNHVRVERPHPREEEEADGYFPAYLFPDPDDDVEVDIELSEAQWLDALLESLADDEDDEDNLRSAPPSPTDTTPLSSEPPSLASSTTEEAPPMHPTISIPYPVPYPALHPPLIHPYHLQSSLVSLDSPSPVDSHNFSYFDIDHPYPPVPDAIEDTSDDESDAPTTPFTRADSPLDFIDPASIPLPPDRGQAPEPHIVSEHHPNAFYYNFDIDSHPQSDSQSHSHGVFHSAYRSC